MDKIHELNERLLGNGMGMVFEMNDLNDKLKDLSPIEILMKADNENFSTHDDYFEFDGYGNLRSYANMNDILEMLVIVWHFVCEV